MANGLESVGADVSPLAQLLGGLRTRHTNGGGPTKHRRTVPSTLVRMTSEFGLDSLRDMYPSYFSLL